MISRSACPEPGQTATARDSSKVAGRKSFCAKLLSLSCRSCNSGLVGPVPPAAKFRGAVASPQAPCRAVGASESRSRAIWLPRFEARLRSSRTWGSGAGSVAEGGARGRFAGLKRSERNYPAVCGASAFRASRRSKPGLEAEMRRVRCDDGKPRGLGGHGLMRPTGGANPSFGVGEDRIRRPVAVGMSGSRESRRCDGCRARAVRRPRRAGGRYGRGGRRSGRGRAGAGRAGRRPSSPRPREPRGCRRRGRGGPW